MKKIPIIILVFLNSCSFSQDKKKPNLIKPHLVNDSSSYVINADSLLRIYIDSINAATSPDKIPAFIYDACFEYHNPIVQGFHSTEDIRWKIINQATNKMALETILNARTERLKQHCEYKKRQKDNETKGIRPEDSFYDLFLKKYKELN